MAVVGSPGLALPAMRLAVILLALGLCADAVPPSGRPEFLAAERALAHGDGRAFAELAVRLHDYPLYPYLRFEAISRKLDHVSPGELEQFLTEYADTPLAPRLRRAWLTRLAKRGRWEEYIRLYRPDDSAQQRCRYLHALILVGRGAEALRQVEPLWLTGSSQPNACDPVFAAWREAGGLRPDLVWRRLSLAMNKGNVRLARYLSGFLPAEQRSWADRWLALHRHPEQVVAGIGADIPHPLREQILVDGVQRLARQDSALAAKAWDELRAGTSFPAYLASEAAAAIGFALADTGDGRGLDYLAQAQAQHLDLAAQEHRLRVALAHGDWQRLTAWIDGLPAAERGSDAWLYWKARALDAEGQQTAARALYTQAAEERSLWGFLAAERADRPYRLDNQPTPADPERVAAIEHSATALRIHELRALGRNADAHREWHALTRGLDTEGLKAAAVAAGAWGWPDQAIVTLAQSGYWDDLNLRFPLPHRDLVCAAADATGIDPSWIYAVMRQESLFAPAATSGAGAIGLMQLMPATAKSLAGALGWTGSAPLALAAPPVNIALGSRFLARMAQRFDGNEVLATAAYNAGPGRVERWLPAQPMAADVWIATIPVHETREYVRRVLAYRLIYDDRLGRDIVPLRQLMRPVGCTRLAGKGTATGKGDASGG
jgi:peptidoglycan lytic transglycosylase